MDHPDPTPAHLLVSQATSGDVGQIRDLAVDNAAFRSLMASRYQRVQLPALSPASRSRSRERKGRAAQDGSWDGRAGQ